MKINQAQMDAAIAVMNNHGFDIRAPWECDLDDREREEFEALRAAIEAAFALLHEQSAGGK